MEPRAYAPAPVGLHFVTLGVAHSTGDVAVDPSLPIDDVEASINVASAGYAQTFGLLGRTASIGIGLPYAWGTVTGDVFEERREARRSGLADARLRLAVNLFGGPARTRQEFAASPRGTMLGASVTLVAPTGEYFPDKLVNLGSNRWSVKPEIGLYHPAGPWSFELAAGGWFFGDNDEFFGGQHREQEPVASVQGHVSYTFRPGLWVATTVNWYRGGETTVGGEQQADLQKSSRAGLTASFPVAAGHSVKVSCSRGVATRIGGDFTTCGILWQRTW
jgi:hypothetical protein